MRKYYKLLSQRLFFIYTVYVVLFTVATYSACLIYNNQMLRKSEQKSAEQIASNIANTLSNALDVSHVIEESDEAIEFAQCTFSDTYGAGYYANMQELRKTLFPLGFSNISAESFAVINPELSQVVTGDGTLSLSYFESSNELGSSFIPTLNEFSKLNKTRFMLSASDGKAPYLILFISSKTAYNNPIISVFLYNLRDVFAMLPEENVPRIMDLYIKRSAISATYNKAKDKLISFTPESKNFTKELAVYTKHSNNWGEITVTSRTPFFSWLMRVNNFFIFLFLFLAVMSLIGALFVKNNVKSMYNPINNILKILPHGVPADFTNEFDALEGYVSSLKSEHSIMSQIIFQERLQLADKFLFQLISSGLSNAHIKSGIVTYGLEKVKFPLMPVIMTYKDYPTLKEVLSSNGLNDLRISIHEYFKQNFSKQEFFKLIDIDHQSIAAISSVNDPSYFLQQLKTAALNLEAMLDISIVIYAGKAVNSWYEIPEAFSIARGLKNKYMLVSDHSVVISAENQLDSDFNHTIEYSPETEKELIKNMMAGNINASIEIINGVIAQNMNNRTLTHEHYSQLVIMLYSTIIKVLTSINKTEKEIFKDVRVYLELIVCSSASELSAKLQDFTTTLINNISGIQKNIEENDTKKILDFVHKNYTNNISLITLADYLNVSQSYASIIFKAATGENFKDYIVNLRLSKAIEIMKENPHIKINELAGMVGYSSNTFTRVFSQKYGVAPSVYIQRFGL